MSWKERAAFMRSIPLRSALIFFSAVAFLFAGMGSLTDAINLEHTDNFHFVQSVFLSSLMGVLWAWFGSQRRIRSLSVLGIVSFLIFYIAAQYPAPARTLSSEQWRTAITIHNAIAYLLVIVGYLFFIWFFRMEGKRFFAAHTEMELAAAIQRKLVPNLALSAGGYEFYGVSLPSGKVGGDLLDVVQTDSAICAYMADVAGHGVPAGVLMSMIKSAVRTRLASADSPCSDLLGTLNTVLTPLTESNVYATFAYILIRDGARLEFSLAAHLPFVHLERQTGVVKAVSVENFPLGMFSEASFETRELECSRGDILAMVTDGLTEVFDAKDHELGSEYIGKILAAKSSQSLQDIATEIMHSAEAYGKITDDRTLLLLRRC